MFDLSTYGDPYIHFERWFYNGGGNGTPNDSLVVTLTNGSTGAIIDYANVNDPDLSTWASKGVQVSSFMTPTSTMQLIVRAMDIGQGHLAEGGFDKFLVADSLSTGIAKEEVIAVDDFTVYPAPFKDELTVNLNTALDAVRIEVYDITGKMIDTKTFNNTSTITFKNNYQQGVYLISVYGNGELIKTKKVIKL